MKQKLDISQIIRILEEQKEIEKDCINNRKDNISKSYYLAKHDFRCIENMEDVYETLEEKKAYYESIGYKCWVEED